VVLLSSRPGRVVREWSDVPLADAEELTEEITGHLREVISTHAAA
jgi:NitT/TauT family transport system ATP-binding protein